MIAEISTKTKKLYFSHSGLLFSVNFAPIRPPAIADKITGISYPVSCAPKYRYAPTANMLLANSISLVFMIDLFSSQPIARTNNITIIFPPPAPPSPP